MIEERCLFQAKQVTGKKFLRRFVLQDISFELPEGYMMGIVGHNGAGKSTLFDYIMNDRKQYNGEFLLDGVPVHDNAARARDRIGFISEANQYLWNQSCKRNAQMFGKTYSQFDMEVFEDTMESFELSAAKKTRDLSRGEMMKFQLAFAIAHKPRLYLLDEATAGMDPVFRIDFYQMLHRLIAEENCSVILSTHLEEEIEKHLDYVVYLDEGRINSCLAQ